ncbi:4Fe-4S dicluster domain-containing protein [Nanoarchaeota archaeon]
MKFAKECLSCSACTSTCPTCCCFDVEDYCELGGDCSKRNRKWISCQVLGFTKVAGGYVFRKEREDRLKHRILHKFRYHTNEFGKKMCIGCGRCITNCPTEIDITEVVKNLR